MDFFPVLLVLGIFRAPVVAFLAEIRCPRACVELVPLPALAFLCAVAGSSVRADFGRAVLRVTFVGEVPFSAFRPGIGSEVLGLSQIANCAQRYRLRPAMSHCAKRCWLGNRCGFSASDNEPRDLRNRIA